MPASRAWDLSSGAPASYQGPRPREIPLAVAQDPAGPNWDPFANQNPQVVALEVWGLGRRIRVEECHFFRRSAWFAAAKSGGTTYDPDNKTNEPGHGYSVSVRAFVMVKDGDGASHVVGQYPAEIFLNGGSAPDGTEPLTGAQGIRFEFTVQLQNPEGDNLHVPAWDLVAYLEGIPESHIGCGDVVNVNVRNLSAVIPTALALSPSFGG